MDVPDTTIIRIGLQRVARQMLINTSLMAEAAHLLQRAVQESWALHE